MKIKIAKADGGILQIEGAVIEITATLPNSKTTPLPEIEAVCMNEAEALEDALWRNLPGGTYDRLFDRMAARKASSLIVTRQ